MYPGLLYTSQPVQVVKETALYNVITKVQCGDSAHRIALRGLMVQKMDKIILTALELRLS